MKKILATGIMTAAVVTASATGTAHANVAPKDDTVYHPVASQVENNNAMQAFSAKVGVATTVGSLAGTAIGAVIGCAVGGVVTVPTVVFVLPACLAAGVTGAGIGAVVGTLVVGGPTAVVAGVELATVLLTPAS